MSDFVQILNCSEALGTCCTDYGLLTLLDILRQILDLIQLVVPIILMVGLAIQFTQLLINPDDNKKKKSLLNKFFAALLCFFVPFLVNLAISLVPADIGSFQLGACWDTARISREVLKKENSTYVSTTDKKPKSFILQPEDYDDAEVTGGDGAVGDGSATGKAIVEYAKSFVGGRYCWGGKDPNVCADCSGFVSYVFAHFGINLISQTDAMWNQTNMYTLVTDGKIKAGDVVMYNGHVGILTGNGEEMVHAASTRSGIKISPSYKYRTVRGIMRIKGVN
ncbi:MAG: C40 family peptidase [bacterium]|nr:C40 family peptidase [Mycoplasmatota bacterium]MDD6757643.1 C40 family peptidase [bacterium]MDY2908671.1 C40 family peptidase [Candidatus Faecimonas sp.]